MIFCGNEVKHCLLEGNKEWRLELQFHEKYDFVSQGQFIEISANGTEYSYVVGQEEHLLFKENLRYESFFRTGYLGDPVPCNSSFTKLEELWQGDKYNIGLKYNKD